MLGIVPHMHEPIAVNIKSPEQQRLEARLGRDLGDYLRERLAAGLSQAEIAADLDLHQATVSRWMRQYGVATRRRRAA